ncbi:hypothetical protein B7463_g10832, partial [Scytalidium lignicola]
MDNTNNHSRRPAKRPRLGEAPNESQLRHLHTQNLPPIQSLSTQQGIINPDVVPITGHLGSSDTGFSEFGRPRIFRLPQLLFGTESLPNIGSHPNQPISTWHHRNYTGQGHLTYEQHNVLMPPQPPMLHHRGSPHSVDSFPCIPSALPYPPYSAASIPNHDFLQLSPNTRNSLKPELVAGESSCHTVEDSQLTVSEGSENSATETVCFGMISNLEASYVWQSSSDIPATFSVQIESSHSFSAQDGIQIDGRIPIEYGEMIQGLIDEPTLTLHISCVIGDKPAAMKPSRSFALLPCILEITVYGPLEIFEEIGAWFQGQEIYLQDPRSCHMEVKYCNPQRLSAHDLETCPLLSEFVSNRSVHQKQALTFMLHREQGWGFNNDQPDIWEIVDTGNRRRFINTVSDVSQAEAPPQFYGGIIADPMGLGKTLTMIALVATDLDTDREAPSRESIGHDKRYTSATLVIVPPPLLGSWVEQLSEHVVNDRLKYRRHHGQTKLTNTNELENIEIVLTTYHTVSAEWRLDNFGVSSILFQAHWRRIILDEAHFIRNGNSRMARAICDLNSVARWAVTGTPIQNHLGDLASLLKFIRVYPYNDPERFYADISQFWKSGEDQNAVKRLERLSACLLLRRAKGTINLPPRHDFLLPIQMNDEERLVYDEIREQTIVKIDEALRKDSGTSRARGYVNVLQQIESLRLFCNLGLHYHSRHEKSLQSYDWSRVAQPTFNAQSEMHSFTCLQCSSILNVSEGTLDDSTTVQQNPLYFSCLRFLCTECLGKNRRTSVESTCGHRPSCPVATVSTSRTVLEEVSDLLLQTSRPELMFTGLSSKVKALITDLETIPPGIKCIVFSTWRLTLNLIERGLDQASLRSIRFDGKVPQRDRQGVIDKFRTDPSIRVMLLTLSCGAVGLTLTAASRAYLMEPHWNPTLEEQALARIYRLGQQREVTTVRLYVKGSFEEQVMQVQESKKHLAGVLLSSHDGGQTDNSLGALETLAEVPHTIVELGAAFLVVTAANAGLVEPGWPGSPPRPERSTKFTSASTRRRVREREKGFNDVDGGVSNFSSCSFGPLMYGNTCRKFEVCSFQSYLFGNPGDSLPHTPAFLDADRPNTHYLTHHTFRLWAQRLAAGLQKAGLQPGDRVLLFSANNIFFPVVFLGVLMAGGIFTGANPGNVARELAFQLKDSESKFLLCADESLHVGIEAAAAAGMRKDQVFIFDDEVIAGGGPDRLGIRNWKVLFENEKVGERFRWIEPGDPKEQTCYLNYSSGTTGVPKGVEITHYNYVANAKQMRHLSELNPEEKSLRSIAITSLIMVPPIVVALAKHPVVKNYDLSSVRDMTSGAAPISGDVIAEAEARWPSGEVKLRQGWGMTEATCSILGNDPSKPIISSSVGELNANCSAKIMSEDGVTEVPQGQRGEIWIQAPNVMKGYWRNEKATKEVFVDGPNGRWMRTGDIAYIDDKGQFRVVDRIKELIKVKGNQVAPAELEALLLEHHQVADACVVGVTINGEEYPRAYIVQKQGETADAKEIANWLAKRVSRYKRLVGGVVFIDAIPKNPSGKILRGAIREKAKQDAADKPSERARL